MFDLRHMQRGQNTPLLLACLAAILGCHQDVTPPAQRVQVTGPASRDNVMRSIREQFLPYGCETLRTDPVHQDPNFHTMVRSLRTSVVEVPVTTLDEAPTWTTVALNHDVGFDAIRFKSPLDEVGDLRLALAAPLGTPIAWHIMSMKGEVTQGFTCLQRELNLDLPELKLPGRNRVMFQPLDKGQIGPHGEYIIWFVIAYNEPVEAKISLKVVPKDTYPHSHDSEQLAGHLGLRTPLQRFDVRRADRLAAHATKSLRQADDTAAIQLSEQAIAAFRGHRQALLVSIVANLRQGVEQAESQGSEAGFAFFRQAADSARNLADFVPEPTDREHSEIHRALFYEAVAFAQSGDVSLAVKSLSVALDGGFHVDTATPWAVESLAKHANLDSLLYAARENREASE